MIFDYNLDGNEDIFVTNGYRKYGSDNDSRIRINETKRQYNNKVPVEMKKRLYDELPSEKLPNLLLGYLVRIISAHGAYLPSIKDTRVQFSHIYMKTRIGR